MFHKKGIVSEILPGRKLRIDFVDEKGNDEESRIVDVEDVSLVEDRFKGFSALPSLFVLPASITLLRTLLEVKHAIRPATWDNLRTIAFIAVAGEVERISYEKPCKIAPADFYPLSFTQSSTLPAGLMLWFKLKVGGNAKKPDSNFDPVLRILRTYFLGSEENAKDLYLNHVIETADSVQRWVDFINKMEERREMELKDDLNHREIKSQIESVRQFESSRMVRLCVGCQIHDFLLTLLN